MKQLYQWLLRLYPREIRATFGDEMAAVFEQVAKERRDQGKAAYARFVFSEFIALIIQAGTARIFRGRPDPALDLRKMRPPDVSRESYGAAIDEVLEAQQRVAFTLARMQHAISRNDFLNARYYSGEDHKARENLRLVQRKYRSQG